RPLLLERIARGLAARRRNSVLAGAMIEFGGIEFRRFDVWRRPLCMAGTVTNEHIEMRPAPGLRSNRGCPMRTSLVFLLLVVGCGHKQTGGGNGVDAPTNQMIDASGGGSADAMVMTVSCAMGMACDCPMGQTCNLQCPSGNCNITCNDMSTCAI